MTTFAQASLPEASKEALCRSLLAEFDIDRVTVNAKGEMTFKCPMPWHDDKSPSAQLNYKKLTFNCWSCGASGGLLWFIATCRGTTGHQARNWLDNQTGFGDEVNLSALLELFDAMYDKRSNTPPPMPKMSPKVLEPWALVHPYLTEDRKIPLQNIIDMNVGYDPEADRIIIPHFWKGSLVGWQSRRIWKDGTPKYLSTPEFPKDRTIYNYHRGGTAVVVEAPMSALRHCHHLPMEATIGASVTEKQARLLAAHDKVVLFMDNDSAGWDSIEDRYHYYPAKYNKPPKLEFQGLVSQLEPYCDVRVVDNPYAADAGDMDDETVETLVQQAIPYALWKRPERLLCWVCKEYHEGKCQWVSEDTTGS